MSITLLKNTLIYEIEKRGYLKPEEIDEDLEALNIKEIREIQSHCYLLKAISQKMQTLTFIHSIDFSSTQITSRTLELLPPRVRQLNVEDCEKIEMLPSTLQKLEHLKEINLSRTYIKNDSLKHLPDNLETLRLDYCENISEIPESFTNLALKNISISGTKISSLKHLSLTIESIFARDCLKFLQISDLKHLTRLEAIYITDKNFNVNSSMGQLPLDRLRLLTLGKEPVANWYRMYFSDYSNPCDEYLIKKIKSCYPWLKNITILIN